jgi:hypothetical protein
LQRLARRLREDFEAGLKRVIGFDQLQMRGDRR